MSKQILVKMKATIFILVGLTLFASYLIVIGNYQSIFSVSSEYKIVVNNVEGVFKGTPVAINGLKIGRVQNIELQKSNITVYLRVQSKYVYLINESSTAEFQTEGFLGDKYINISSTDSSKPLLKPGSILQVKTSDSIKSILSKENNIIQVVTQFFEEGHKLLETLNKEENEENFGEALKNVSSQLQKFLSDDKNKDVKDILKHTKSILRKIDRGKGTLGAIVNDRSLHNQALSFLGGKPYKKLLQNVFKRESSKKSKTQ